MGGDSKVQKFTRDIPRWQEVLQGDKLNSKVTLGTPGDLHSFLLSSSYLLASCDCSISVGKFPKPMRGQRVPEYLAVCRCVGSVRTQGGVVCRQANLVLMVCCSLLCSGLEYTAQANLVLMVIVRTPAHPLKPTLHTFCPKCPSWARFNLALSSLYYFSFTEYFIEWAMSKHNTNNVYFIIGTRFWSALIHCDAWLKEPCFIFSATCWFLHMFMHSAFCSCDTACARHFAQFCTILQDILQSFTRELAHMQSTHASGRANS